MARGARPLDRDAPTSLQHGPRGRAGARRKPGAGDGQGGPEVGTAPGDDGRSLPASAGRTRASAFADRLPPGLPPRCLSREQAAAYLGIGEDLFDRQVQAGILPRALPLGSRRVWDRAALDRAVDRLSDLTKDASSATATPGKAAALEALRGSR